MSFLSIPRLPLYEALGVPEVWRFDGETLTFLSLIEGKYQATERFSVLPLARPEAIITMLEQAQTMGETSRAKQVRRWAQSQLIEDVTE
ncbi:MAG: hypothetical protein WBD47_12610 [Phormidesmis sp.]